MTRTARKRAVHHPNSAVFLRHPAPMHGWLPPVLIGSLLWGAAGWFAHPREIWDVPAFWPAWGASILAAAVLGSLQPGSALRQSTLLFAPLLAVLLGSAILTGRGFGLLPLGLLAVVVLALPALGLAALTSRLFRR